MRVHHLVSCRARPPLQPTPAQAAPTVGPRLCPLLTVLCRPVPFFIRLMLTLVAPLLGAAKVALAPKMVDARCGVHPHDLVAGAPKPCQLSKVNTTQP